MNQNLRDLAVKLGKMGNANVFIETGTFHGVTTKWASKYFDEVHTIEKSDYLYNLHRDELLQIGNVIPHLGDSRDVLPLILENLGNRNAVFWLDGHFLGGNTAGENDPCPLLGELSLIFRRSSRYIILIDDARLFSTSLSVPQWPTIIDLINLIHSLFHDQEKFPFIQICDDVIFITPNEEDIRESLMEYILNIDVKMWDICRLYNSRKISQRIINILKLFLKKIGLYYIIQNKYYKINK
ncbi:hypothetical protein FACS1894147_05690 [Spirochaetia bacterium]|nr:hypothetical protein FACS1894147_05690 [Spirochaetia bacterium]